MAVAIFGLMNRDHELKKLQGYTEVLQSLPEDSQAYESALSLIASHIAKIDRLETVGRRDPMRALSGMFFALVFGYITVWLMVRGGLWQVLAAVSMLLAFAGFAAIIQALQIVERDKKGKPIQGTLL
ncbi:hypothetical protein ACFQS3_24730 [Glycomyces mayteni]|uniref:Uncharacterized protein n=1 Tax=Glycomyces mayteni TaxID=543887 RepID=A0ABW2DI47_9ACTN